MYKVGRSPVQIRSTPKFLNPSQNGQNRGAPWQPFIGPRGPFSFAQTLPRVQISFVQMPTNQNLPRHPTANSTATRAADVTLVPRVTHPVVTRVTQKLVKRMSEMPKMHDTCHAQELPRVLYGHPVSTVRPYHVAVRPAQSAPFFFYLFSSANRSR